MAFDWETQFDLAIDGRTARARFEADRGCRQGETDHCSMCGEAFCAVRTTKRISESYAED